MMKKINLFVLVSLLSIGMMGQEKKSFTLNDLLPGGNTFHQLYPQTVYATWWGDQCIETETEACYTVEPSTGKKNLLFTLEQLNGWINGTDSDQKTVFHCYNLKFPYPQEPLVQVRTPKENRLIDFKTGKTVWQQALKAGMGNTDWNSASRHMAFTVGDNLHVLTADGKDLAVSTDGSNDLVYGKSVHRDEFGINKGTFWSPDGRQLAFYRMDQSMVPDYPQVDISTRIATTFPCKYPMAGEKSHEVSVGIYNPETQKTVWLKTDNAAFCYLTNLTWSPDGKRIYLFELNRDQNHMRLVGYNAANGERTDVYYEEKHPKYVEPQTGLYFLPWDSSKALFLSQRDGYNHLYVMDFSRSIYPDFKAGADGATYKEYVSVRQLTQGEWVVLNVAGFNKKEKSVIIRGNERHPLQANWASVKVTSGKRKVLDNGEGVHNGTLSAEGTYILDKYSAPQITHNVDLLSTATGKRYNLLTANDPWAGYNVPEIIGGSIKAADGQTDLYYRMVKPTDFDPNKKYPTIIYVYGGPHAHNVEASRNYLARGWEIYMAQKGYLIFVLDNRGSEHRGRKFENATFRQLGVEEMKDQMEGVKFLKNLPYVDENRIGVHGWSFGGFMTTNLMLTYPDVFKVGVAGGPVIDWQYYEVMYGERYMDTPQDNPEGYKGSNLRLKAGNLKGKLQIIIGYNDPICVPQHTLSFLRACIDAGKQVDFFAYPGGEHNMFGQDQVHLHERISQYFDDYLK